MQDWPLASICPTEQELTLGTSEKLMESLSVMLRPPLVLKPAFEIRQPMGSLELPTGVEPAFCAADGVIEREAGRAAVPAKATLIMVAAPTIAILADFRPGAVGEKRALTLHELPGARADPHVVA